MKSIVIGEALSRRNFLATTATLSAGTVALLAGNSALAQGMAGNAGDNHPARAQDGVQADDKNLARLDNQHTNTWRVVCIDSVFHTPLIKRLT